MPRLSSRRMPVAKGSTASQMLNCGSSALQTPEVRDIARTISRKFSGSWNGSARTEAAHDSSGQRVGFTCNGGAQRLVRTLGLFDETLNIPADGSARLPGTIRFKGPKKGKDVVSVNVTAEGGLESNTAGYVDVRVDGKPLKPGSLSNFAYLLEGTTNTHAVGSAQFCGKVGRGRHNLTIRFRDTGATSGWHVHTAMAHVEINK